MVREVLGIIVLLGVLSNLVWIARVVVKSFDKPPKPQGQGPIGWKPTGRPYTGD